MELNTILHGKTEAASGAHERMKQTPHVLEYCEEENRSHKLKFISWHREPITSKQNIDMIWYKNESSSSFERASSKKDGKQARD